MKPLVPAVVAEFIGTFALCFFGIGTRSRAATPFPRRSGWCCACSWPGACTSRAQFNPAVWIGLVVAGKQKAGRTGVFIVTQIAAAVVGTWLVCSLIGMDTSLVKSAFLGAARGDFTDMPSMFLRVIGFEAVYSAGAHVRDPGIGRR